MKTTNQWLDAAKTVLHIDSDRGFAIKMGWPQSAINHYRGGRAFINNTHAAQIAELLGVNPLVIIADAETERAKDDKQRLFWANAAKKFGAIAASVLIVTTIALMPVDNAHSSMIEKGRVLTKYKLYEVFGAYFVSPCCCDC